jgi:outer membrane biosynthesis protein TonB
MSAIAIVAGRRDAQFAEQVRAALQAAGREAAHQEQLPADASAPVVLIWSAGLESAHTIDAKTLIGLWSEDRLTVVRRDETPLPLGLRDLPSLGPANDAASVARKAIGLGKARSQEPASTLVAAPAPTGFSKGLGASLAALIILLGGVTYYYFTAESRERQAAALSALEAATRASEELSKAKQAKSDQNKQAQIASVAPKKEAAAPKAETPAPKAETASKAAAPKAEEPKVEPPRPKERLSRSERERLADEEAARKALAKASREPARQEVAVASAAPTVATAGSSAATEKPAVDYAGLYEQAVATESNGDAKSAIRLYRRAARAGSGKAAKRLGEIYDRGVPGVPRDYAESLQWYETARQLGETVETAGLRGGPMEPAPAPAIPPRRTKAAESEPTPQRAVPGPGKDEPLPVPIPKPAPKKAAPAPAPAPVQEAAKGAAPEPVPAPAAVPAPMAAPSAEMEVRGPMHERRPFNWRYLLIGALALAFVLWRRARKRRRRAERAASQSDAAPAPAMTAAAPPAADDAALFVSYSHKDRSRVEPIVSVIEEMGRRVWMDRTDITGQAGWAGQIVRAIRECRAVVLMASPNSYSSDQVVRELYLAMNHKKAIVPIEIEPAEMPDELQYILAPYQHHRLSGGEARAVLGRALAAI